MDFSLFGRYFLDIAVFYPGAFLCLAPLWEHVKAPRRTAVLTAALVTAICLAPFVRAGACCLCFKLGAALLSPLCSDSLRRLLSGIGSGFALLLGMLGASCTILYLELVYAVAMVKPI